MGFFEKSNEEVLGRVLSDFGDIIGVKEVVDGYLALVDSEVYKKTAFIGFVNEKDDYFDMDRFPLLKIVANNLTKFPLKLPFTPLFGIKDFYVSYSFIWNIWRCQLNRELTLDEGRSVFYNDLAARIIFFLEDFDSDLETPTADEQFFKKLGKIKKMDKSTKELSDRFLSLRTTLQVKAFGESPVTFGVNELGWTHFLAGCSAVHSGRNVIGVDDLVVGNKVYIKLVNTDLDSLIRSL
jgi:hypothetical protein